MRKTLAIFIILLAVAVAGCAPGLAQQPPAAPAADTGVTPGKSAPRFTLKDLGGNAVAVPAPGRVTVVNFWATWCPPCREEMPELQKFAAANPAVAFYAVNIQEPAAKVQAFLNQQGYTMPVLLDAGGNVAQTYRVTAIPTTVVVDKDGVIKFRRTGPVTDAELAGLIRDL